MKLFNHILQGHEATEGNAYAHANGFDWSEDEATEKDKPEHSTHIDSVNGVGIYYDYAADYYFFEDQTEESELSEEQIEAFVEDLSGVLNRSGMYKQLQDLVVTHTGKSISNDSQAWHDLEEMIVNKLIEESNETAQ